jgi:hypothetical protein
MRSDASRLLVVSLACALVTACANGAAPAGVTPVVLDSHVITAPELRQTHAAHAYEAVRRLHPEYLRTRGPSSIMNENAMGPAVFVDRMFIGPISVLADLPIGEVERIRFVSAWDATTTYGVGYSNGVIEVTTKRGGQ